MVVPSSLDHDFDGLRGTWTYTRSSYGQSGRGRAEAFGDNAFEMHAEG